MRKTVFLAGLLTSGLLMGANAYAAEFTEADPASIAGYYHSDEQDALFLASGKGYSIDEDALDGPYAYSVLSDGDNFIFYMDDEPDLAGCFAKLPEKGRTESGGVYYAFYTDCAGKADEVGFEEGKQVQFGDYVFDNDYEVVVRDSLSVFYDAEGAGPSGVSGKLEGEGFSSPEEAVSAYVKGLQDNDINEMLSAYAVETYVENYNLAREIESISAYSPQMKYIPTLSDMASSLNKEQRRTVIMNAIRYQYLLLTDSPVVVGENAGRTVALEDTDKTAEELIKELFVADDTPYLSEISFDGEFYDPAALDEEYLSKGIQKLLKKDAAAAGAEEVRSVVAKIRSAEREYILCMDTVRYEDRWYVFEASGTMGAMLGISVWYGGLMPVTEGGLEEILEGIE